MEELEALKTRFCNAQNKVGKLMGSVEFQNHSALLDLIGRLLQLLESGEAGEKKDELLEIVASNLTEVEKYANEVVK